ncbi:hypothetical protein M0802_006497 [Mischocyttarus mexicanus]|nr:hypothetical protein M0802_006497 [Mischocyttarus mexicanus]
MTRTGKEKGNLMLGSKQIIGAVGNKIDTTITKLMTCMYDITEISTDEDNSTVDMLEGKIKRKMKVGKQRQEEKEKKRKEVKEEEEEEEED